MGLISGPITTTRYKLGAELSDERIIDGIKKFRFPEIDDPFAEYISGWTSAENNFLPDFEKLSNPLLSYAYIVLSLRIDKKIIPASVIKKNVVLESARRLKESGKKFLSKAEQKEIKEQVTNLLAGKMPLKPEIHDVLINLDDGTVTIFSGSKSVCDEFETLFAKSFGVSLIRLFPFTLAAHRSELKDQDIIFGDSKGIDSAVAYAKHKQLGSDFLTWLWYRIEGNPLQIFGPMTHLISLSDTRKITLENSSYDAIESTVIKNDGDDLQEAYVAMSKGAKVTQLGLKLNINDDLWIFSLKDKDLSPVSMKMPATEPANEGWEGAVLEKIFLYGKATEAIEEAFSHFVCIWSDDSKKDEETREINKWINRETEA